MSSESSAGAPAGTPHYLSPEQTRGEPGDARADLYALGVTAWHALTGTHPFDAPNVAGLLVRQSTEPAPSLGTVAPHVSGRMVRAIDRCLARLPVERWPSAEELAVELNAIRARRGERAGPMRAWLREVLPAGNDIGMGLGGVAASLGVWVLLGALEPSAGLAGALDNIFVSFAMAVSASLFGGLALVRLGSVAVATRDLVESGHDHDAARPALAEAEAEADQERRSRPRADRQRRAWVVGALGASASAGALALATLDRPAWLYLPATVASVLLPMITARVVLSQLQNRPSLWSRLMRGRFGRLLFKGASWFSRRKHAPGVGQPTIAVLGMEAESLFKALPAEVRNQLHDLPAVLAALRDKAERLRAVDREGAEARVSGIVAAMEAVRLELMSMGAGIASLPDVTRNLEQARRIAERVDAALRSRPPGSRSPLPNGLSGLDTPA